MDKKFDENQYKNLDEWYEAINEMYEEDAKTNDYSNPKMDKWFYGMLEKERRQSRRRRIAGMAAGITLILGVGTSAFTQVAYGESLIDILKNSIEAGRFTISGIGNANDNQQEFEEYESPVIQYEADSIEDLFEQITEDNDTKIDEFFYVTGLPVQYQQWTAKYNKEFQKLTLNAKQKESYLYIYEELNYENVVSGTIVEAEIVATVFNENLQLDIDIIEHLEKAKGEGYYIEVFYNNKRLLIEGNGTLKELETIAKNISILERN